MERSRNGDQSFAGQPQAVSTARPDHLAFLGEPSSASEITLHPQVKTPRPGGRITVSSVLRLVEFQQYRCAMTGRPLTPETASLDHIVPVRLDGEHVIENVQVLHKEVNRAKATMTSEEFIRLCREVVAYVDSQSFLA